ncbi:MAG: DoxX family protein [Paraburkholderia sp.]|uniref:DoxX family protein n=1 Tax=Paraburkholderia sp. TaxID=1926495 RepID=UPI0011F7F38C|nr:DoxX family protein [Paraburkholderia sp.]TAM05495.1 MAG: DoxX family protein [Paraburkholderia sp.]
MKASILSNSRLAAAFRSIIGWLAGAAGVIAPPLLRLALAVPFFKSGLTKWDGLSLSPAAFFLFEDEFKLHIFGHAYDLPMPDVFALVDSVAEIGLPVLLVIGLATRFSALGLLVMVGVIQLVVPEGWANFHLPWATLAVTIVAVGPGKLSLDWLIRRRLLGDT